MYLSKMDFRKFTLIELLVVIAIIAILAAILMPALSSARERGKVSTCVNNLKTLGVAYGSYVDDYDGFLVPSSPAVNSINGWASMLVYKKYLPSSNYAFPVTILQTGTNRAVGVFRCPSAVEEYKTSSGTNGNAANAAAASCYGLGSFVGTYITNPTDLKIRARKLNQYKHHSKVMIMGDKHYGPYDAYDLSCYSGKVFDGMRHNGTGNYLFADFHVENRQYYAVPSDVAGSRFGYPATCNQDQKEKSAFWARLDKIQYWPGLF